MKKPKPYPYAIPRRPEGQITRGKTAPNRLRRVDIFLLRYAAGLLTRSAPPFADAHVVDLGFGAEPQTTLEMAARLRRLNPTLPVLGVEIDPERVAAAAPFADDLTAFRLGGFNLPLNRDHTTEDGEAAPETVRLLRAFNVLRQYDEEQVTDAYRRLGSYLLPGGLLVEGTSDPPGRFWVANILRRWDGGLPEDSTKDGASLRAEGLLFSTNFRAGFEPAMFQPVLPKNLIHHMQPGQPIYDFFAAWKQAHRETAAHQAWGLRRWFVAGVRRLAELGYPPLLHGRWLNQGYLMVRHPDFAELVISQP